MSGVTGVLLSYGEAGGGNIPNPFPGVSPAFTLGNLDTLTVTFSYGCVTMAQPSISSWDWGVEGMGLVIEKFSNIGSPTPDPYVYPDIYAIDYPETTTLCHLRDGEIPWGYCDYYPSTSVSVPVGINFANFFLENPSATECSFNIYASVSGDVYPEDAVGSYYTVSMLNYTGGVYHRNSYDGNTLTQVGGVPSATSVSYTRYYDLNNEYQIPAPPASYNPNTSAYILYVKETRTAYIWLATQFPTGY